MMDNVKNVIKKIPVEKMFCDHPFIFSIMVFDLTKLAFQGTSMIINSVGDAIGHAIHGYPNTTVINEAVQETTAETDDDKSNTSSEE